MSLVVSVGMKNEESIHAIGATLLKSKSSSQYITYEWRNILQILCLAWRVFHVGV